MTSLETIENSAISARPTWTQAIKPWLRWPAGTWSFAFRTWLALSLALYIAFVFELQSASTAAVCIMLVAQPVQGMVLSKSIYRTMGTLIGVVAALIMTSLFPQDRTMILAAFTIWIGLCTAVATILRDFRAYGTVLAGYTVAMISISNIDAPASTFTAGVDRIAAILVGIIVIALVNSIFMSAEASRSLLSKLRLATRDVIALAGDALDRRGPPDPLACVAIGNGLLPLRSQISFATPELPRGRQRAAGARSALLALFELLTSVQAVGTGLKRAQAPSAKIDEALDLARRALRSQRPERSLAKLDDLIRAGLQADTLALEEAYVLDRLRFMITTLGDLRDGLRSVRRGNAPRRTVSVPVHQDYLSVLLNFTRVIISVGIVCALGVWSGQSATTQAILFSAVYVSLGSISPNPTAMGITAIVGLPITVAVGIAYRFFIFPALDGFPLLSLSLLPVVLATCYLMMIGQQGWGAMLGTMAVVLIAPSNPQLLDPDSFIALAVMFVVSGVVVYLSFKLIIPVQPAQRRLRLALAVGTNLRKALRDERRLAQPRASLQYDRLSQFQQWLSGGRPSLARRKTLMRLNDFGNLAYAVRRAWRALDAAAGLAPAEVETRARMVLPSLTPDATEAMARAYLEAAKTSANAGLALVAVASALYGTALITTKEARLLRRVELLGRMI